MTYYEEEKYPTPEELFFWQLPEEEDLWWQDNASALDWEPSDTPDWEPEE